MRLENPAKYANLYIKIKQKKITKPESQMHLNMPSSTTDNNCGPLCNINFTRHRQKQASRKIHE